MTLIIHNEETLQCQADQILGPITAICSYVASGKSESPGSSLIKWGYQWY